MVLKLSHDDVPGSLEAVLKDIETNPAHLEPLDPALVARVYELIEGVEIDLDAPLGAEDE